MRYKLEYPPLREVGDAVSINYDKSGRKHNGEIIRVVRVWHIEGDDPFEIPEHHHHYNVTGLPEQPKHLAAIGEEEIETPAPMAFERHRGTVSWYIDPVWRLGDEIVVDSTKGRVVRIVINVVEEEDCQGLLDNIAYAVELEDGRITMIKDTNARIFA